MRAKISRSITVVLLFTFIQSVAGPILIPKALTSAAEAASACVLGTDYTKDIASVPGFTILKFTKVGSCSLRNTEAITTIDYLVVGGGGGGGAHVGGGGGGGGVLQASSYSVAGLGAIPITVGGGGTGAWVTTSWQSYGSNGGNSSINGVTAYGGGVGGIWTTYAPGYVSGTVGSAGGSGSASNYGGGTAGQGRAGGIGNNTQPHAAGGGGGAGQVGGNGTQTDNGNGTGGKGGDGIAVIITGTSTYFGGGGGGGLHGNNGSGVYTGGAGGLGGGAAGASHSGSYTSDPRPTTHNAASGLANTGGGGGGDGAGLTWVESRGGNGGSGIVIIRYANSALSPNSQDFAMTTNSAKYMYTSNSSTVLPGTISIMTLEAWVKPSTSCDASYHCMIFTVEGSYLFHVYQGKVAYHIGNGSAWCDSNAGKYPTTTAVPSDSWSHVALVRNGANVKIYINGKLRSNIDSSCSPTTQAANTNAFYIGARSGYNQHFIGSIDEARIWSTDRSANVSSDMHSNETSTSGLANYWNFNEGSGLVAFNQVPTAPSENDLIVTSTATWDADAISTTTTSGVYTVRTFYRTYITATGGFTMPTTNRNALVVVVGGGGGGGSGGQGGGGGGGGFIEVTKTLTSGSIYPIVIGVGGGGNIGYTYRDSAPSNGGNSTAFGLTAIGGGYGGSEYGTTYLHVAPNSGGSGGGGTWGNTSSRYIGAAGTTGQGFKGGDTRVLETSGGCSSNNYVGAGGGGAGAAGQDAQCLKGGDGGAGINSTTLGTMVGGGGAGAHRYAANTISYRGLGGSGGGGASAYLAAANPGATGGATNGIANTGGGGGGGIATADTNGFGGNGGSGIVAIKWITNLKPIYTAPVNAYLNVGMTETFTTNVAQDSATVSLTRTFRWESSTSGVNGTYSVIKQGTGESNAFFTWVPTDTSTSGSTFAYRVVVTDSDTAGLFIVDTSTPVYAVINRALVVSGSSTIAKAINVSKNETFTITLGTSTYRPTLSPVIPGISIDTSTAGIAVIRIAETVTVGTYYETLTVTDSVSAVVNLPLTINVSAPPTLLNSSEIVSNDLILHLDAGNSQSLIAADTTTVTSTLWRDLSGNGKNGQTTGSGTFNGGSCSAPTYYRDFGGYLNFSGSGQCYWVPYLGTHARNSISVEAWFRSPTTTIAAGAALFGQAYPTASQNIDISLGSADSALTSFAIGVYNGASTTWQRSAGYVPTINTWTHLVGTYDGSNFRIYANGALVVTTPNTNSSSLLAGDENLSGYFIGRRFDGTNSYAGDIASIRVYDIPLSLDQVQQNFNATKERFLSPSTFSTRFTQKYGQSQVDTFTVTSGYGSKTSTFAVGNRSGVVWDTATVGSVRLSIQDSLTVGTYEDTITVTDSLSQTSYLPIKLSITKADTITVTVRNPKTFVFTGQAPTTLPDIAIVGLVSSDTGTATRVYSAPASAPGASDTYTALVRSSVVPSDVETYTVTGETLTSLTVGSLSNYQGVIYETSTLTITKARQPALFVNHYGAVAGTSFTLQSYGGAGTGAFSETVTAGSTAANCSVTGHVLSNTSSSNETKTCVVTLTRAASRNYFIETATATIYFFAFIINQPSQVGSGPGIGLSGATAITLDPNQAPTITGLSTTNLSLSASGNFTITGGGFGLTQVTVKFWRNKSLFVTSSDGSTLVIPIASISALSPTTGKVMVLTSAGTAVSIDTLTIAP